jgi:hypothetical protein
MNLYLYIPLTSAHPAKILHSLIYGRLCAYKLQNSNTKDFVSMAVLLAKRLCLCGYSLCTMIPIFQAATNHLMERATHSLPSTEANQTYRLGLGGFVDERRRRRGVGLVPGVVPESWHMQCGLVGVGCHGGGRVGGRRLVLVLVCPWLEWEPPGSEVWLYGV